MKGYKTVGFDAYFLGGIGFCKIFAKCMLLYVSYILSNFGTETVIEKRLVTPVIATVCQILMLTIIVTKKSVNGLEQSVQWMV